MKIALYIEDGLEQLVLTPQGEHERALLGKLGADDREMSIVRGRFFESMAGFVRHTDTPDSTMIVLRRKDEQ